MATYKGYLQDKNGDTLLPNVSWENIIDKPNPYPIGTIYLSVDATDPSKLFGGEWEQIKDVFLLAGGNTYEVGSTGGEANHTLTVEEMPSHNHTYNGFPYGNPVEWADPYRKLAYINNSSNPYPSQSGLNFVGGSKEHNNMPPYLAVYVWKRVA